MEATEATEAPVELVVRVGLQAAKGEYCTKLRPSPPTEFQSEGMHYPIQRVPGPQSLRG